jgi:hypothetical protein
LPVALPFAFAFASEQKSDNSSFFRMKNEKQELSSQEQQAKVTGNRDKNRPMNLYPYCISKGISTML